MTVKEILEKLPVLHAKLLDAKIDWVELEVLLAAREKLAMIDSCERGDPSDATVDRKAGDPFDCGDECGLCAILDCPENEYMHYHHDGCPSEFHKSQGKT